MILNYTFSAFTNTTLKEAANIKVNDMNYSVTINGSSGTIITAPNNKDTVSNLIITSLNEIESKYEIIYKVCSDIACNNVINKPDNLDVEYSSRTIDPITGAILSSGQKSVRVVVINNTSTTYYIQIGINAGYSHNTLALQNLIINEYNEDDVTIAAYIDGELLTSFPTTSSYTATVTCTVNNNPTTATGTVTWDGAKWVVSVSNVTTGRTVCNVNFILKIEVDFASMESNQIFNITKTGVYLLSAWGSQGANSGGKGGFISGEYYCEAGTILTINTGTMTGYNGGGTGTYRGGGATTISNGSTYLIAAAGGGGNASGTSGGSNNGTGGESVGGGAGGNGTIFIGSISNGGGGSSPNYSGNDAECLTAKQNLADCGNQGGGAACAPLAEYINIKWPNGCLITTTGKPGKGGTSTNHATLTSITKQDGVHIGNGKANIKFLRIQ